MACLAAMVLLISCRGVEKTVQGGTGASLAQSFDPKLDPFYHGVASGDPTDTGLIIWTRVTPATKEQVPVSWEVSRDSLFGEISQAGQLITSSATDYTVHVRVTGLAPGTRYYYRFHALGKISQAGRGMTLPAQGSMPEQVSIAVLSCTNYEWGYFNALRTLADREDVDFVLHLGDYIYEYAPGGYGDTVIGRIHEPPHEIVSLSDYRTRYAQYRLDPDMQAFHRNHTVIAIWDDHEIANDANVEGAQNHQDSLEGNYADRVAHARQAYFEWMPKQALPSERLYWTFDFGRLARLNMLDERLAGRNAPVTGVDDPHYRDTTRTILGSEQFHWLEEALTTSTATWNVLGNQVIFSSRKRNNGSISMDAWSGYPFEQKRLAEILMREDVKNPVILSGDTHRSFAIEVRVDGLDSPSGIAVEFGTPSVNSANSDEYAPAEQVKAQEKQYLEDPDHAHIRYVNFRDHGYTLVRFTPDSAVATFYYVDTVKNPSRTEEAGWSCILYPGDPGIHPVDVNTH